MLPIQFKKMQTDFTTEAFSCQPHLSQKPRFNWECVIRLEDAPRVTVSLPCINWVSCFQKKCPVQSQQFNNPGAHTWIHKRKANHGSEKADDKNHQLQVATGNYPFTHNLLCVGYPHWLVNLSWMTSRDGPHWGVIVRRFQRSCGHSNSARSCSLLFRLALAPTLRTGCS